MSARLTTKYPGIRYREFANGRVYIVGYTDGNGQYRTKHCPYGTTLEQARTIQGDLKVKKSQGASLVPTKMTVSDLLEQMDEAAKERYSYSIGVLNTRIGNRKAVDLSPSEVARLIRDLKGEGKKTWTVKKILTPLNSVYRAAVRDGMVARNPVETLLPHERPKGDQKEMRCLSGEEISSLLTSCTSGRWKTLFATLTFCGLRVGEALALTWDDITEDRIIVRKSKTKAGEREVILIPALRSLLAAEKLKQAPGVQFVFATHEGAPVGRREALRALRAAEKRAGIPNYTLHELRHTFASILIHQGELPTLVAKQMGHADPSITMKVYAHLFEAQASVDAARDRLETAMGGVL